MEYSDRGLSLTKGFESCRFTAYLDSVGVPTIGYGHTAGVKIGDTCTQAQADEWLMQDLLAAVIAVNRLVKVPLTQGQFDALVDFTFNLGAGNLQNSTLLRRLNERNYTAAAMEFLRWNRAGGKVLTGLTRRRLAEQQLFNG